MRNSLIDELSAECRRKLDFTGRMDEVTDTASNGPTRSYQLSVSHSGVTSPSSTHPGSSMLIYDHSENIRNHTGRCIRKKPKRRGRLTSYHGAQDPATSDWRDVGRVTIDMLPDLALLELFDFYVNEVGPIEKWHTLVHVCQRWRNVVFRSPRRLGLQLFYTARKPVSEMLDVWPPLPIVIRSGCYSMLNMDNIVAALKHSDRVCEIRLWPVPSSQWENVLVAMERSFPELTELKIQAKDETAPIVPNSFLGGFAPRIRSLRFERIPFPGLPKLILSATGLVKVSLHKIPHSGYISPEAMVACLSTLTSLAELDLSFMSPQSCLDQESRRPPPLTRSVLPALRHLGFVGVSEYLEDLVVRIDCPLLDSLQIKFFHQLIFDTPRLTQFVSRSPELKARNEARVVFSNSGASVLVPGVVGRGFRLEISCTQSDWQLSSLAQACSLSFPQTLISSLEHLYICDDEYSWLLWQDDIENSQWLELLQSFSAVKNLHLSRKLPPRIVPALREVVNENMTEILPVLQCLYLEVHSWGPTQEAIVDVRSLPFKLCLALPTIVSRHSPFRP